MPTDARQILGLSGEDIACRELTRRGYAIVARRYRTRSGEIDIIARDGETLVFVEVKARSGDRFGAAADAVTPLKRHRVARMAHEYLARSGGNDRRCRFDVVTVDFRDGKPIVAVYANAWAAGE